MTKNDNAIDGQVLAAIRGRWRVAYVAVPLLGLLGGCASDGGARVAFDEGLDGLIAGVDHPGPGAARQAAASSRADAAAVAEAEVPPGAADSEPASEAASPAHQRKGGSYVVFGKRYQIEATSEGHVEKGLASWYGGKFHGRRTASGERYDMYGYTAAHKSLPLPTYAEVTNLVNGRSILVKVNDRGPFVDGRVIDLSYAAAKELRMVDSGVAMVEVRAVDPGEVEIDENMFLAANRRSAGASAGAGEPAVTAAVADGSQGEVQLAAADGASAQPAPRLASAVSGSAGADAPGATPAAPQQSEPAAAAHLDGKLYVKAGEFGSRDGAERLRRRLVDHLAEQVEVRVADGFLSRYAVQIGPLASPAQAKDVSEQLVALGVRESATSVE
ncbi:septal ring lytic transglycosylase RlpA family protein [Thiococcus pfennigii]|uniref:septal ring lytic transglycosylase RlpA family protein n=1 Tax=Thiococcus pfennigii TaxID=1057 RepID=UPI001908DB16|nr:septal ring lytic transglycosylase RlpA family protein [Thiococcus pfennigii]MBK1733305.1 hypothetical protein [Thiococcus pfennigii]